MVTKQNTRNEALEFARRATVNLGIIEDARRHDNQGHVITQLALSLLGIVVFPKEDGLPTSITSQRLADLAQKGWPTWNIPLDEPIKPTHPKTETLDTLLVHVRNAVAHGRISFTSDAPNLEAVGLLIEDATTRTASPHFKADISASDLKDFCLRFLKLLDERVG